MARIASGAVRTASTHCHGSAPLSERVTVTLPVLPSREWNCQSLGSSATRMADATCEVDPIGSKGQVLGDQPVHVPRNDLGRLLGAYKRPAVRLGCGLEAPGGLRMGDLIVDDDAVEAPMPGMGA